MKALKMTGQYNCLVINIVQILTFIKRRYKMEKLISKKWILSALLVSGFFLYIPEINASDKIGRPVRVVSLSFYEKDIKEILKIVDQEGAKGTDIIVLPETWRGDKLVETLEGESITELSKLARKHNTYIISPIERKEGKYRFNSAVLIGRDGMVQGCYDKVYPFWSEFVLDPPVDPGIKGAPVFETDFGKIGIAICFDANFPEVWQVLSDNGAEIVFWPSAYSAGSHLQAYALLHHYYIVSSTWPGDCQVYDITGARILDEKSDNITIVRTTLDLDRGIYHENYNLGKRDKLLKEHADAVEQEVYMPREAWFVLKAKKTGESARRLAKEYGIEELVDYQNRSRKEVDRRRGYSFTEKLYLSK
jgi:predicted amidohydrolase